MQTYNKALGVKCNFCHVPVKGFIDSLDYVSDTEPMKENGDYDQCQWHTKINLDKAETTEIALSWCR